MKHIRIPVGYWFGKQVSAEPDAAQVIRYLMHELAKARGREQVSLVWNRERLEEDTE